MSPSGQLAENILCLIVGCCYCRHLTTKHLNAHNNCGRWPIEPGSQFNIMNFVWSTRMSTNEYRSKLCMSDHGRIASAKWIIQIAVASFRTQNDDARSQRKRRNLNDASFDMVACVIDTP